eukprot:8263409-Pyramimonas_sp.AAC.1
MSSPHTYHGRHIRGPSATGFAEPIERDPRGLRHIGEQGVTPAHEGPRPTQASQGRLRPEGPAKQFHELQESTPPPEHKVFLRAAM